MREDELTTGATGYVPGTNYTRKGTDLPSYDFSAAGQLPRRHAHRVHPLGEAWAWTPGPFGLDHLDEKEREWLAASRKAAKRRSQALAGLSLGVAAGLVWGLRRWRSR